MSDLLTVSGELKMFVLSDIIHAYTVPVTVKKTSFLIHI